MFKDCSVYALESLLPCQAKGGQERLIYSSIITMKWTKIDTDFIVQTSSEEDLNLVPCC